MRNRSLMLWRSLVLALLLCVLCMALFAMHAAGTDVLAEPPGPAADDQICYTLDTTRPEWLSSAIYLPVILKDVG